MQSQTPDETPHSKSAAIGANRRGFLRQHPKSLLALIVMAVVFWFVPPVYKLRGGSVRVTQWLKNKGKIAVVVGPDEPTWIPYQQISKHLLHAVVVEEDARFYDHHGLDFEAIHDSIQKNLKKGRYVRGGSTITQQVVKMAFLGREKTLLRKTREAVGALLLELVLPKERILEWYVNMAEWGDNIYGIRQAAKHYFHTKPELLTIEQAVNLALVLPSPNGWSVGLRRRRLTRFGHKRFAMIVTQMRYNGYITEKQWERAVETGDFSRPIKGYEEFLNGDNVAIEPGTEEKRAEAAARQSEGETQGHAISAEPTDDVNSSLGLPSPALDPIASPNPSSKPQPPTEPSASAVPQPSLDVTTSPSPTAERPPDATPPDVKQPSEPFPNAAGSSP